LVTPDGRVIADIRQLSPEDVSAIRAAGEMADGFLFDYADQPRIIKLASELYNPS